MEIRVTVHISDKARKLKVTKSDFGPKLTVQDVLKIRRLHDKGRSIRYLAKKFDVDRRTVGRVIDKVTWRHV